MQFLICPASDEMIDATEDGELFQGKDGDEYMYSIDFDGETVLIEDTVGRKLPFDVEELDKLLFMLNRINNFVKNTNRMEQFLYAELVRGAST